MPFFSVVVPVYNVEKYLKQCIESILNQTYSNFELILVDDGSKDASGEICDTYAAEDARVKVIHKANGGVVSARKAGLQQSSGNYIVNIDSDDYIATDYLSHYWEVIQEKQPAIVVDNFMRVSAEGEFLEEIRQTTPAGYYTGDALQSLRQTLLYDFRAEPYNAGSVSWNIWSKAIKRELAEEMQMAVPDCIRMGEDCAMTTPAICKADSLYITGYCGYYYRQIPTSMVRTFNPKEAESMQTLLRHFCMLNLPMPEGNIIVRIMTMLWGRTAKAAQASGSAKAFGEHMKNNYGEIIAYVTEGMKHWPIPWGWKFRMLLIRYGMWSVLWHKYHK